MATITTLPYTPPAQALPTYLSYSTYVITHGTIATITETIVELPLTYYGPSIPLGTDGVWVWGGLTSPTSTSSSTTTSTHPLTTTSTGSSQSSSTTTSVTSSQSSSSSSSPSTGSTATSPLSSQTGATTSATSTSTTAAQSNSNINDKTLLVIVLVIVLFFLVVAGAAITAWLRRRRQARTAAASPNDGASGIRHRGVTFRRVLPGVIFNSLARNSPHRHSRLPQDEETGARPHPNDSDWDFAAPSDMGTIPSVRMVTTSGSAPAAPAGAGVVYHSISPFDDSTPEDDAHSSHAPSASSSQNQFHDLPRTQTANTTSGQSQSDMSTSRSLFFIEPMLQSGETFHRDPRIFPDSYALGENRGQPSPARFDPLPPAPPRRVRTVPPPVDEELALPPLLIERSPPPTPRRTPAIQRAATPLMAYPDSPVSDPDEAATLLRQQPTRLSRSTSPVVMRSEPPGTGTAGSGLVSRLSGLFKRFSISAQPEQEHTTPFLVQDPSSSREPEMTERQNKMLGFLSAPPPPSSFGTRRTGATAVEDRPISTVSGRSGVSAATVYHEARSRPSSPGADVPPDYDFSGDSDAQEIDVLDVPAPRSLRYPPGLTPPEARFLRVPSVTMDDLEEADIVPDEPVPIPGSSQDMLEDAPPMAEAGWSSLHGKKPDPRATLGQRLPFSVAKSPAASPFGSHSTRRSENSGSSSSRRSRRTVSSISSSELRRMQQSSSSAQEPFVLDSDEMPVSPFGHRLRGGSSNPLLSATFGPPTTWLRPGSRSASVGSSRIPTPRSGRSVKSKEQSGSASYHHSGRSSSQHHSGQGSHPRSGQGSFPSLSPSPQPRELRLASSFSESASSLHRAGSLSSQPSRTTAPTTEPSQSVRYVPSTAQLKEESDEGCRDSLLLVTGPSAA